MKLNSNDLEAFYEVAQTMHFTKAAKNLGVTQSALSQRVSKLESTLSSTLLVRSKKMLQLTPAGEKLLRFCQVQFSLESEFLKNTLPNSKELVGEVRIAAYSSILKSILIPGLAHFRRKHPQVMIHFFLCEMSELTDVLYRSQSDFVFLDYELNRAGVIQEVMGKEDYVVVESSRYPTPEFIYLDHDSDDQTTLSFLHAQGFKKKPIQREFMGGADELVEGVAHGYGRALISRHMIEKDSRVKVVSGFKPFHRSITLHYFEQPYYSKLHEMIVQEFGKIFQI